MKLRVGSVSTGIGGDAVAWHPLGWESVFFSEIDAFPCAVLAARYPDVPNLGDFTAADFCDRARACGPIDVFAGGTPCQAFSVAGKRGSLDDDRGNLTLRFVEIGHELDTAVIVWEQVPGVLSTEDNAFGCFLGGMVGAETALIPCDDIGSDYGKRYWRTRIVRDEEGNPTEGWRYPIWPDYGMVTGPKRSLAWRILDAQHFGLAQRRRRVCVVSFRARDNINPGAVLFEPESLRRYSAPSRGEGARVAGTLAGCSEGSGHRVGSDEAAAGQVVAYGGNRTSGPIDVATACNAKGGSGRMDFESETFVAGTLGEMAAGLVPVGFNSRQDPDVSGGVAAPLDCASPQAQAVVFDTTQITHPENRSNPKPGDPCHPLAKEGHAPAVAFVERGREGGRSCESQEDLAYALLNPGEGGRTSEGRIVDPALRVRRLMPVECERLQGFADGWTRIPWKKKSAAECPDGHRYKGLGNAWARNVFTWLGHRIELVLLALKKRPRWAGKA